MTSAKWLRCAFYVLSGALLVSELDRVSAEDSVSPHTIPLQHLPQNTRYAIWGDSITEVTLYPRYIETYLLACAGRKDIKVCTFGHSGEQLGSIVSRQSDFDAFHPTLVSFNYGMNDTQYSPYTDEKGAAFDKTMHDDLAVLKAKGITQIVVAGPGLADDTFTRADYFHGADSKGLTPPQAQSETLGHFSKSGYDAAVSIGAAVADIHDRMLETYTAAKKVLGPNYTFAKPGGGIHPSANGHLMITYEILKALGCDGNIGTFDVDMKGVATASTGHTVVSFSNGVLVVNSSRIPFCFNTDPNSKQDPESLASILPFLPFNQDLNRFVLKVKNLGAPTASVTWGTETKQFTSDQLAAGVNLAQEFEHTPFDTTFARVMEAIYRKQDFENFMIKGTSNYFGNDNGGNVDTNMIAVQEQKDTEVKAMITPVRHTIVIVPAGAEGGAPIITGSLIAYSITGQPFTYPVTALNTPTSFAATDLPKGLTIDATSGQISGTVADTGKALFQISATNAKGTGSATLTLVSAAPLPERPQITSPLVATATVGSPFTYQTVATNNPSHYFVTSPSDKGTEPPASSLPAGLVYDTATGLVSGTPTKAGAYTVQVAAMNDAGVTAAFVKLTVGDK